MSMRSRFLSVGTIIAAVVLWLAPGAGATILNVHGHRFGAFLQGGSPPSVDAALTESAALPDGPGAVDYNGGQVLHSSSPWLIFWDPTGEIPQSSHEVLTRYLTDVSDASGTSTNDFSVLRQYTDGSGFADNQQSFGPRQVIDDRDPYPAAGCPQVTGYSTCLTDDQIVNEIAGLVTTRGLPEGTGDRAPIYVMVTPQDVNTCFDDAGQYCGSNYYCSYHSYFTFTESGVNVLYDVVPFSVFELNPVKGCQSDGTPNYQTPFAEGDHAYSVADDLTHELSETITDPLFDAWYSDTSGNEVADNCEDYGPNDPLNGTSLDAYAPVLGGAEAAGSLYDQVINGDRYYNQTDWSNGDYGCRTQTSAGTIAPRFTFLPGRDSGSESVTFDGSGTQSSNPVSSSTWSFGDGGTSFSTAAPTTVEHTYAHPGAYLVTLTVVDSVGNLATARRVVLVP